MGGGMGWGRERRAGGGSGVLRSVFSGAWSEDGGK